ncbi:hypothetical protein ONZ43_g6620 [Nemania bipapillata]|uniref:Uncharacterized protein n=1 Tax=Nemania bipapillata TaxID=110536 RepID=A0ACC2HXM0_9PEZI|nr:hypothetical protein ONZ43_g6620 [Nemania bipapillata]
MLCQRCPWFQGLFNGRSRGKWLEGRRAMQGDSDLVKIDLRHMNPEAFHYVLQYLYADVGEELFDSVVANSIDEFSELVMDVMNIANELMLDRLSQICQKVIGRFVSTRNISTLLNLISPFSVTEFKEKGLEYICLQMEAMLENHLLDGLDEELLHELDEVVRDNQLARCPFARSGRAELLLHEQNPGLAHDVYEERQARVRDMAFKAALKDDERRASSYKARFGSFDDISNVSPTVDKVARQRPKEKRNEPFSPELRPKSSVADLMFNMDGDEELGGSSPTSPSPRPLVSGAHDDLDRLPSLSTLQLQPRGGISPGTSEKVATSPALAFRPAQPVPITSNDDIQGQSAQNPNPWGSSALPVSRLDLREVLAEAKPVHSALSAGLAAQSREASSKFTPQKLSQKERKKQLQQQAEQTARQEAEDKQQALSPWSKSGDKKDAPWKKAKAEPAACISDLLHPDSASIARPFTSKSPVVAEASSSRSIPRRAASPDTRFSGQKSNNAVKSSPGSTRPDAQPVTPHSKSYIKRAPRPEQEIGLPLADIIGQQQREQQSRREAVAKRSLQEIQQEQAFQEWWDQESRRTQEEEARRLAREENKDKEKKKDGGRRSRGSNKPKGGPRGGSGGGVGNATSGTAAVPEASGSGSRGKARTYRGKGKA